MDSNLNCNEIYKRNNNQGFNVKRNLQTKFDILYSKEYGFNSSVFILHIYIYICFNG